MDANISREKIKKISIGFIDLEKTFDSINWKIKIIYNLYKNQVVVVGVAEKLRANIRNEVKQGRTLLPPIFNVYVEGAVNEKKRSWLWVFKCMDKG